LTAKGIDFESVNYMEERLSVHELKLLLHRAGLRPQDALRTNEAVYRQHVAGKNLSDDELLQILTEYPEMLQRPIVLRENKAVLARPLEELTKLGIG
jgi:arsenate reductase